MGSGEMVAIRQIGAIGKKDASFLIHLAKSRNHNLNRDHCFATVKFDAGSRIYISI